MYDECISSTDRVLLGNLPGVDSCILRLGGFSYSDRFVKMASLCSMGSGYATRVEIGSIASFDEKLVKLEMDRLFPAYPTPSLGYTVHVALIKEKGDLGLAEILQILGFESIDMADRIESIFSELGDVRLMSVYRNTCIIGYNESEVFGGIGPICKKICEYVSDFYGSRASEKAVESTYFRIGGFYFGPIE